MKLHLKTFAVTWLMAPMFLSAQFHCVSFDALTLGTQYGDGINNQGDWIFTEDNIDVTVEYFEWPGGGGMFGTATVIDGAATFGTMNSMWTSNINLGFDFSGIGYTPNRVVFDFIDSGGNENISVNGSPIYAGELVMAPMPPGITMIITDMGAYMRATLYGPVVSLVVGGQEFDLDNICAMLVEDPSECIDFELLPLGAEYGDGHNIAGEVIFTENDVPVAVDYFVWPGGGGTFGTCTVIDGNAHYGTGQAMWTSNINLVFDFSGIVPGINWVSFDFRDEGGNENIALNNFPVFAGELPDYILPPGFTMGITDMGDYQHLVIVGGEAVIEQLLIGGQEFSIDNVCFGIIEDPSDCVDFEMLAMGAEFGAGHNPAGWEIFMENNIGVFVEYFEWSGGGGTFGNCWVIDGDPVFGTGQAMWTSNINLRFDVQASGDWNVLRFDFRDDGGEENLVVNVYPLFVGEITAATLPPGFVMSIDNMGDYQQAEIIYLDGLLTDVVVGGQEFSIDNVCTDFAFNVSKPGAEPDAAANLGSNYPNPFNGVTAIPFRVNTSTHVLIAVYDHLGKQVALLADADYVPGEYTLNWDAAGMSTGVYLCRMTTAGETQTRMMVLK